MSRSTEEQDSAKSRGRAARPTESGGAHGGRPKVVLRLLRGEDIGEVSRGVSGCAAGAGAVAGARSMFRVVIYEA